MSEPCRPPGAQGTRKKHFIGVVFCQSIFLARDYREKPRRSSVISTSELSCLLMPRCDTPSVPYMCRLSSVRIVSDRKYGLSTPIQKSIRMEYLTIVFLKSTFHYLLRCRELRFSL